MIDESMADRLQRMAEPLRKPFRTVAEDNASLLTSSDVPWRYRAQFNVLCFYAGAMHPTVQKSLEDFVYLEPGTLTNRGARNGFFYAGAIAGLALAAGSLGTDFDYGYLDNLLRMGETAGLGYSVFLGVHEATRYAYNQKTGSRVMSIAGLVGAINIAMEAAYAFGDAVRDQHALFVGDADTGYPRLKSRVDRWKSAARGLTDLFGDSRAA